METLRPGSRGPDVELLQLALARAGFNPGGIDGDFGPITQEALVLYQRAHSLTADGIAESDTWARLRPYLTGYVRRQIRRGETFWTLSGSYNTSFESIAAANPNVSPQSLQVGQAVTVPLGFSITPVNVNYTSTLLSFVIEGLKARYPFLDTGIIGYSVLGRPIRYLAIGNGSKEVFYNAAHHANEWITTPLLLKFLEDYSEAYAADGTINDIKASYLYHKVKLYIVPMVNPDGMDLVTGEIIPGSPVYDRARMIAHSYPAIPFPNGWKANIAGVDLNLQYPAGWERAREQKFANGFMRPGPRDFVGTAPLSEPESSAVFNFTRLHNFSLTVSYHTQGEVIYWRYLNYLPANSLEIAKRFGIASGYPYEETPEYSGYAGYKDWFIQTYNRPGYTIEAGIGESPLPLSQFGEIYAKNIGTLTLGIDLA